MSQITELEVNGVHRRISAAPEASLLSVLREQLDLTGTKYGCGEGQCGACTVLIEGVARKSCLTPVSAVAGKRITTIEDLDRDGRLHPIQRAFLDEQALQCGYCSSGMILTALALLSAHPNPSRQEIVQFMEGNICRCGVYPCIVAAIRRASELMREASA